MKVSLVHSGRTLRFSHLDATLARLLLMAPGIAREAASNPVERGRLLPKPSDDDDLNHEWAEFVEPGLEKLFLSAADQVARDMAGVDMCPDGGGIAVDVPLDHADAWLNCLNSARLALNTRHAFDERDMAAELPQIIENERDAALFQIHFFGILQECLIARLNP